jgi:secreted PhoX family phosphatase
MNRLIFCLCFVFTLNVVKAQHIADFTSMEPSSQNNQFVIPETHVFQKIIESGDLLTNGDAMPISNDFTGYVPISGSSTNGYLSINKESTAGGATVLDVNFNATNNLWQTSYSQKVDFSPVVITSSNCSGTVTPWNTIISSEEATSANDSNSDGYYDLGWNVEIDPASKTVINKVWALGNFKHENIVVHSNERTAYQGADSNPGYIYKFVANTPQNLHSGLLYVYVGPKEGQGNWVLLNNSTPEERNTTLSQSLIAGATSFNGVEDVEIGPDGMVYFAVKDEGIVYRFQDSDPISGTIAEMEIFVGNMSYNITHNNGITNTPWGNGNDNLAFDNLGNLWVLQDGGQNYIWVVEPNHTQVNPKVKLFGISPLGSEPTGITFSPDYKYLFMSIQHPLNTNVANQVDASGAIIDFNKSISFVVALQDNLGQTLSLSGIEEKNIKVYPNPLYNDKLLNISSDEVIKTIKLFSIDGRLIMEKKYPGLVKVELKLEAFLSGIYVLRINEESFKLVIN